MIPYTLPLDWAACTDAACPSRRDCHRFLTWQEKGDPRRVRQTVGDHPRAADADQCADFMERA